MEQENLDKKDFPTKELVPESSRERKTEIIPESFKDREAEAAEAIEKEIQKMKQASNLDEEAKSEAKKIKTLELSAKVKKLLELTQERGVVLAVRTAKSLNDPYVLDTFHDILSRDGLYEKFAK